MRIVGKRGSHIDMMIAFSLFMLLFITVMIFLQPNLKEKGEKENVLGILNQNVIKNISSNLTLVLVKIDEAYSSVENCIEFDSSSWGIEENVAVNGIDNQRINSNGTSSLVQVDWVDSPRFLKIYSSSESFEESPVYSTCASITEGSNYSIGSIRTQEYPFEQGIEKLKTYYDGEYEDLKDNLGLPIGEEFGFIFINNENGRITAGNRPSSESVYSQENKIIYVNNKSEILLGRLIVEIW